MKLINKRIDSEDRDNGLELVECTPKFTEDIPNMYMTSMQTLSEDVNLGLKNKIKNMKIYIDSIMPN